MRQTRRNLWLTGKNPTNLAPTNPCEMTTKSTDTIQQNKVIIVCMEIQGNVVSDQKEDSQKHKTRVQNT